MVWPSWLQAPSFALIAALLGVCLGLNAPPSHAAFVWDQASLVSDRVGFEAVLVDPDDPQTVWVASSNTIWVSDDGGEAWYGVVQLLGGSRVDASTSRLRSSRRTASSDDDLETEEDDTFVDEGNESKDVEPSQEPSRRGVGRAVRGAVDEPLERIRLRLVGDMVYLMSDRGLWRVPKSARGLGQGERLRLRRQTGIIDVALSPWGTLLISTRGGLLERSKDGQIFPAPHALGRRSCGVMLALDAVVLVASERSLWRVEPSGARRVGLRGLTSPIVDMVRGLSGTVGIGTSRQIRLLKQTRRSLRAVRSWGILDLRRLSHGDVGVLWAATDQGIWRLKSDTEGLGQLEPQNVLLGDRRMTDLAVVDRPDLQLWAVGRGGLYRRIGERALLEVSRARLTESLREYKSQDLESLLTAAVDAHAAGYDRVTSMGLKAQLAFILPRLRTTYIRSLERQEDIQAIEELQRNLLTDVYIWPGAEYVQVMATWDLYPAIWSIVGTHNAYAGPTLAAEITRNFDKREDVRSAIVGLYQRWINQRLALNTQAPSSPLDAVKRMIALQHTEADLHVLSAGTFQSPSTSDR